VPREADAPEVDWAVLVEAVAEALGKLDHYVKARPGIHRSPRYTVSFNANGHGLAYCSPRHSMSFSSSGTGARAKARHLLLHAAASVCLSLFISHYVYSKSSGEGSIFGG
jgi:hypothetical protein